MGISELVGNGESEEKFRDAAKRLVKRFSKIQRVVGKNRKILSAYYHQIQDKMWD